MSAFIISGCANQPKAVDVEVIPNQSAIQSVPVATTAAAGKKPVVAPVSSTVAPVKQTAQIPEKFLLNIAFSQQAPFSNWDAAHEETCEEASMIMADRYYKRQPLNEQIMEEELQELLKWESERGYKVDLTAQETVDVLKAYFGLTAHLSKSVTVDQIKYELSQGKPIIIPAAGRELHNPNFKQPGPIYHMLLIKGYNSKELITNDPGTRKGNGYSYAYDVLLNAIHDWNPVLAASSPTGMTEAGMLKGEKIMIVIDGL